jgi:hypothetical protein
MLFSIIIILLVLAIAYFHYAQGLFGATLSAIIAVIAATLAVSYHETLESLLSNGGFADSARAITLVALFAAIYLVLRLIFDAAIPGNIRLPVTLDRVGGAIMGLIAGIFAAGVVAVAAQTMPFGPSIAGYSLYQLQDERSVTLPGARGGQWQDAVVHDELKSDRFNPNDRSGMILPVDSMLLGTVAHLSDGGSLAGKNNYTAIHPDYLTELFGQRIGLQPAARHTAVNGKAGEQVKVVGVYQVDHPLPQINAEFKSVRTLKGTDKPLTTTPGQMILVVRIVFNQNASGTDKLVRFSPGSIHLVANGKDYYPVGTLEKGTELYANKPDDFLFIDVSDKDRGADVVFVVDAADVKATASAAPGEATAVATVSDGTFISVKRAARIDLSGKKIQPAAGLTNTTGKDYEIQVMRKAALNESTRK